MARLVRLLMAVLVVTLWPRSASAQASLDLAWTAPAGCPDQPAVIASVQHLVTTAPPEVLHVTATVREDGDRWTVALVLSGAASGTRTLRARSCAAVARGAALIVALALDPNAKLPSEDAPAEEPPRPAPPSPVAEASPPTSAPPPPRMPSALRPFVLVGATGERALQPGVALGLSLGGGVAWRALRVDLTGQIAPSRDASLPGHPGAGGELTLLALAARGCAGPTTRWLAVAGCVRLRGARIAADGTNLTPSYRQTAYMMALEPGAVVRIPGRTRLAVELDASAVVPFTRPDFVVITNGANDPLFRAAAVGARVGVGATYRF